MPMSVEGGGWLGNVLQSSGQLQAIIDRLKAEKAQPKPENIQAYEGNYLGSDFGWLRGEFRNLATEGDPAIAKQAELAQKQVAIQSRRARAGIEEKGAQSGFRGANANLYTALFEQEAQATEGIRANTALQQSAVRQQALGQLSGLSQFEGGQRLRVDEAREATRQYEKTFQENVRQFGLQYALEKRKVDLMEAEQEGGGFMGFLGGALGTVAGFALGGIGGALGGYLGSQLFGGGGSTGGSTGSSGSGNGTYEGWS